MRLIIHCKDRRGPRRKTEKLNTDTRMAYNSNTYSSLEILEKGNNLHVHKTPRMKLSLFVSCRLRRATLLVFSCVDCLHIILDTRRMRFILLLGLFTVALQGMLYANCSEALFHFDPTTLTKCLLLCFMFVYDYPLTLMGRLTQRYLKVLQFFLKLKAHLFRIRKMFVCLFVCYTASFG